MCIQSELPLLFLKLSSRSLALNQCTYRLFKVSRSFKTYTKFHRHPLIVVPVLQFHATHLSFGRSLQPLKSELVSRDRHFREVEEKSKKTFLQIIDAFNATAKDKKKRGHVEFIYSALNFMEEYGVTDDPQVYKKLMDIFPKGKMIPKSLIQAEFFHHSMHQECALVVLDKMERNALCPDKEMKEIILATFGFSSLVFKKYAKMLYWMPKLKNINPYLLPDPLPKDIRELARLALKKMSIDKRVKIEEFDASEIEEAADKTWIMSAQSPAQQKLIEKHPEEKALYIEGPSLVWLRRLSMTYFVLRADSKIYPEVEVDTDDVSNLPLYMFGEPKPKELVLTPSSIHEQEDGIIMALCCTGSSSKDSLLSWIRFLRETNPKLDSIPVLFKIRTSPTALVAINIDKKPLGEKAGESKDKDSTS